MTIIQFETVSKDKIREWAIRKVAELISNSKMSSRSANDNWLAAERWLDSQKNWDYMAARYEEAAVLAVLNGCPPPTLDERFGREIFEAFELGKNFFGC